MISGVEKSRSALKASARCAGGLRFSLLGYFFDEAEPEKLVAVGEDITGVVGADTGEIAEKGATDVGVDGVEGTTSTELVDETELSFFRDGRLGELTSSDKDSVELCGSKFVVFLLYVLGDFKAESEFSSVLFF